MRSVDGASNTSHELKSDLKKLKLGSPLPVIETSSSQQQEEGFESFTNHPIHESAQQHFASPPVESNNHFIFYKPHPTEDLPPTSPRFMHFHLQDSTQGQPLPPPAKPLKPSPCLARSTCETGESLLSANPFFKTCELLPRPEIKHGDNLQGAPSKVKQADAQVFDL